MSKIIATVLALGFITAATAPSFAFDSKKFWEMHLAKEGS